MSTADEHYEHLLAEHYTWMLGGDLDALVAGQAHLLRDLGTVAERTGRPAVDLGCGSGAQTLALAELGFAPVIAVDTSRILLDELSGHAGRDTAIRTVRADIRGVLPEIVQPGSAAVIVCMGDTLTHLPGKKEVTALLGDVAEALAEDGKLVITYRDLTEPLHGTDRFIPLRSTEDRVMTCFLEYPDGDDGDDGDTVMVHDLLHTRSGDTWTLRASAYPKLRISPDWLAGQCRNAGLEIRRDEIGPRGMRVVVAGRGPVRPDRSTVRPR
ncbi:methyltransferase domain-containing protein [Streptosporangium sp. CA-135522]|uniref:class I SAM-dependent methyltransferase n=1 Tax=Streptosporangium sp. CA-135522 TaxID=3240072 RepID=UPI003D8AD1F8